MKFADVVRETGGMYDKTTHSSTVSILKEVPLYLDDFASFHKCRFRILGDSRTVFSDC